jgi:hypothetical protein
VLANNNVLLHRGNRGAHLRSALETETSEPKGEKKMENSPSNRTPEAFKRERELFLSVVTKAYRQYLLERGRRPTQYDIAELLLRSRATLNRHIAKYRTSWTEIGLLADCEGC